jgi:hypothetical protein
MEDHNLEFLIAKFERDIAKRSRTERFFLSLDQMLNVIFWNGSQDETVSSHIGRTKKSKWLCCILKKLEYNHCKKSIGE